MKNFADKGLLLLFGLLAIVCSTAVAQSVVTMPHNGVDTLWLTDSQCVTILDPGGDGMYENDEDSYLYILSDNPFYLQAHYVLGYYADGRDWVKLYRDTIMTSYYLRDSLTGNGDLIYSYSYYRCIIHFHSNDYGRYDGFTITLAHPNSITNWTETPLTTSSVQLSWQDYVSSSSGWTVYYWDNPDSVLTQQTATNSATITGLHNDTWYSYYIENNDVPCHIPSPKYMRAIPDSSVLMGRPASTRYDTLDTDRCYVVTSPSGMRPNNFDFQHSYTYYNFNKGRGAYIKGYSRGINYLYFKKANETTTYITPNGNAYHYLPEGWMHIWTYNKAKFHYEVLYENGNVVIPVVSGVTDNGATVTWADSTAATSWKFRYRGSEGAWHEQITSVPSVTLTGLAAGEQYIYTIEGIGDIQECLVPEPHAFITTGGATDTIIMPFRSEYDTINLNTGVCYTMLDCGGDNRYFEGDYSRVVLRAPEGSRIYINGECWLATYDRLYIMDGSDNFEYTYNNDVEHVSRGNMVTIAFESDLDVQVPGFVLHIRLSDSTYTTDSLTASSITSTSAHISWRDTLATSWTLYFTEDESHTDSVVTTQTEATLTGLTPATQYVYYVVSNLQSGSCAAINARNRKGFITSGLASDTIIIPYRSNDTVDMVYGQCYHFYDPGGPSRNYFDNDSTYLYLSSASPFAIDGEWFAGSPSTNDVDDKLREYNSQWLSWNCNNSFANRIYDGSGYVWQTDHYKYYSRLFFQSDLSVNNAGYTFDVVWNTHGVDNVSISNITGSSAQIGWTQSTSTQQSTVWYGPHGGTLTSMTTSSNPLVLSGLQSDTQYDIRIGGDNTLCHASRVYTFRTEPAIGPNDIVMPTHGSDTVTLQHGGCYTVYDPGGMGNYFPSDTSLLVLRTATGEGLYYSIQWNVDDELFIQDGNGYETRLYGYPYSRNSWVPGGIVTLRFQSNEAIQTSGFVMTTMSASTAHSPNYQNMTDSTVTITWQDSSSATSWKFSYGPHVDSMTTVVTTSKQYHLTGLRRNKQYYYSIYNTDEENGCYLDNTYGIVMPTDSNLIIMPYLSSGTEACHRTSLYYSKNRTLSALRCQHVVDDGNGDILFRDGLNSLDFNMPDAQSVTLRGYYEMGSAKLTLRYSTNNSTTYTSSVYTGTGYIDKVMSTTFSIETSGGGEKHDYGFDFDLIYNYKPYNITTVWGGADSAWVTWADSMSTTWTVMYGPAETLLDTIETNQPSAVLTGIRTDQQYIVYIVGNSILGRCKSHMPAKTAFLTVVDSSLIVMPYRSPFNVTLNPNICYTIVDHSRDYDYFYDDFINSSSNNSILNTPPGVLMTLRGWFHADDSYYVRWYDENNNSYYNYYSHDDNFVITNAKTIQIRPRINEDTDICAGYELHVSYTTITNIQTSLETDTTCRLTWSDVSDATLWTVHYGISRDNMDSVVTDRPVAHLHNLDYGMHYIVYITSNASSYNCMDTSWFEFCSGNRDCIDYTDITSCFAQPYYGSYDNPRTWRGLVNFGPDSIDSRHTVIVDTTATDPRTGNLLRCVPTTAGAVNSVRLGNWGIGAEAESMQYSYRVDTTRSEAMVLRYAVVLENPGHIPAHQPRFRFEITDEKGNHLDQLCYSADFVSSGSLGWNSYSYDTNYVLWKDWTPVGVNLQPLHGQRINVNLTTYDCRESGHFGYAYYTLECGDKDFLATNCGEVHENTFIAPEGFSYQWYNVDSANIILGTGRTFTSNRNGTYKCRAFFPGAGEGSNCYFEKTVIVGDAYPYANFDYAVIDTNDCLVALQFYNRSVVTSDSLHTIPTAMECGRRHWDFGDGTTSDEKHPMHYFQPGWYDVTLSAMVGSDSNTCTHDTTMRVFVPSPCITYDSVDTAICQGDTLWVRETPLFATCDTIIRDDYSEDSILATIVHLVVHPVLDTLLEGGLCDGDAYTAFGFNENIAGSYVHPFQSVYGCDSIYRLNLIYASRYDTSFVVRACDNIGYTYRDTTLFETTEYVDSLMSIYLCDSVTTISLTIDTSYHIASADTICQGDTLLFYGERLYSIAAYDHTDSTVYGCDSNEHLTLWVNPRYSTFDTIRLCSYESYTYRGVDYTAYYDILDSLMTTRQCDSVIHIAVILHDSTFRADAVISDDGAAWRRGDTLLAGCTPMKVWLSDSSVAAESAAWYFGDGESSSLRQTTHIYPDTGVYTVTLIAQSPAGCLDTVTMVDAIQVFPTQSTDFAWTPEVPSIYDARLQFINLTEPVDSLSPYRWYFYPPDADTTDAPSDSVSAFQTSWQWATDQVSSDYRQYVVLASWRDHVTLRNDTTVCHDTVRHHVTIANIFLQFPNAVTPNGDGVNDTWMVVNLADFGYYPTNRIRIYDRWGRLVYRRDNIRDASEVWDPNECDCPDGTYFFRFDAQGEYGFVSHNGVIEVVR